MEPLLASTPPLKNLAIPAEIATQPIVWDGKLLVVMDFS
jgi:hypothetical protein